MIVKVNQQITHHKLFPKRPCQRHSSKNMGAAIDALSLDLP